MKEVNLKNLKEYKPLLMPVLILVVLLILSLTLGKFLLGRFNETRAQLQVAQRRSEVLAAKAEILRGVDEDGLSNTFRNALAAIPSSDPTLPALARTRELAVEAGLRMSNLRVSSTALGKGGGELKAVELRFDLDGALETILAFSEEIRKSAPLMQVSKFRASVSGTGLAISNITLNSVWAALPGKIGKVDEAIKDLTREEQEVLSQLEGLERPSVAGPAAVSPPQGRTNPFSF